jgi:hypothetical protein
MRQPRLMKLGRTNIDGNCLHSDVAHNALADFLNWPHPSLKYAIQFLLIQTSQNLLQGLKELILVRQLNPFGFFFDMRNK